MLQFSAPRGAIVGGWGMDDGGGKRRFRFEDKASEVARVIHLPVEMAGGDRFKEALRSFLALLGELARRCWP